MSPPPKQSEISLATSKIIMSKVNSGLARSKSSAHKLGRRTTMTTKPKMRLDLSPSERLNEDLKTAVT